MKIRNGFVSNSSSTAFVVDISDEAGQRYFKEVRGELHEKNGYSLGRNSGWYAGREAQLLAERLEEYIPEMAAKIYEIIGRRGIDNVLVVMDSDEDDYPPVHPEQLDYTTFDYH